MQAGLEAFVRQQSWKQAAIVASNLSVLDRSIGDLPQALIHGQEAVELADRSGDPHWRTANRTTLAAALHASGRLPEADTLFQEAEAMQKERQPNYQILYSLGGYQYCELLLDRGEFQDVQNRAGQTLRWVQQQGWLLDIALDHLSLGRAHWLRARHEGTGDEAQAIDHLERAVTGLRRAGEQVFLPLGLLARAELYRGRGDLERARRDIDAALTIAERGGMGLHQADCHLAYARLHLDLGAKDEARRSLATAKPMIERMGYHRRDGEVTELEGRL
jgi:tetratricopeptide (TPR) repeat protein